MATNTIVACFDDPSDAQQVERELAQAGIPRDRIHLLNEGPAEREEPGFWESLKQSLGFADESDRATYPEAARRGGLLVSVDAPETETPQAIDIMRRHHAIDLDQRASQWRQQGWTGYRASAQAQQARPESAAQQHQQRATGAASAAQAGQAGKEVIPVVQEELQVGKRQVQAGGVRVYTHVTEKPVEEKVRLREEHVDVERRPVDRPLTAADQPFQERTIEARETREQPVVKKEARVVEEVSLNKDIREREQTVRDTVRRTDVDVQKMPPGSTAGSAFSSDAFINDLSADARYRGRTWDTLEPDFRRSFEQRYPHERWDQYRDDIRRRWEGRRS
jgi:uncharacterized protein (TIGR02271 family)